MTNIERQLARDRLKKDIALRCEELLDMCCQDHYHIDPGGKGYLDINENEKTVAYRKFRYQREPVGNVPQILEGGEEDDLITIQSYLEKGREYLKRDEKRLRRALRKCRPDPMESFLRPSIGSRIVEWL